MRTGHIHRALTAALVTVLGASSAASARAASNWPLPRNALAADGPIVGMTSIGNLVYVTGDFGRIGRFTGSGVALDAASGVLNQSFPAANGQISYVLADGQGGWYIGGDFTEVGGFPRTGLAHIFGNGLLDPQFAPRVDGLVDSLALNGDQLFVGGFFKHVDGSVREGLAAVSATTGALLAFDAHQNGAATELAFLPAASQHPAVLYAGMGQVLALDPATGAPLPGFNSNIQDDVTALAVNGQHLYVGGNGIVALNAMTGVQDPNFNATPVNLTGTSALTGSVESIVVQPGRLLVGGTFNALGGAAGPLVALDLNTGAADRSFRPQIDGTIYDMDQSGAVLWVGGILHSVAGRPATNVAALDATSGAPVPGVHPPRFGAQVNGVRASGNQVYAGGQFFIAGYSNRHGFAAFQAGSLALDPGFDPPAPFSQTLSSGGGRLLAADNQFQGYDPHQKKPPFYYPGRSTVQVLDPSSGLPAPGFPAHRVLNLSGIALSSTQLFTAQRLQSNVRFPRNQVTVSDLRSGAVVHRWLVPLKGYVSYLAFAARHLYAAGSFKRRRPDGRPANLAIVALDPATGVLDAAFDPHANGPIYALAPRGHELYFAGLFKLVRGARRHGLAAVTLSQGSLDRGFDPVIRGDNLTTLSDLGGDIFLQNPLVNSYFAYHPYFLDPVTGSVDRGAGAGLSRFITAATAARGGVTIAAEIDTPLQGYDQDSLDFIRGAG